MWEVWYSLVITQYLRFVLCYVSGLVPIGHSPSTLITIIYDEEESTATTALHYYWLLGCLVNLYILHFTFYIRLVCLCWVTDHHRQRCGSITYLTVTADWASVLNNSSLLAWLISPRLVLAGWNQQNIEQITSSHRPASQPASQPGASQS